MRSISHRGRKQLDGWSCVVLRLHRFHLWGRFFYYVMPFFCLSGAWLSVGRHQTRHVFVLGNWHVSNLLFIAAKLRHVLVSNCGMFWWASNCGHLVHRVGPIIISIPSLSSLIFRCSEHVNHTLLKVGTTDRILRTQFNSTVLYISLESLQCTRSYANSNNSTYI
jgi:hypothetical protein